MHEFKMVLKEVSEIAVTKALIKAGLAKPIIYRTEAIKIHGFRTIEKLEKFDLIKRRQHHTGGNYYYDVNELNEAIVIDNRHLYPRSYGKTKS